jgi:hypothetical protein
MKSKSVFSKYKPIYDHGQIFSEVNPDISLTIKNFAVNSIYEEFKKNKDILNDTERKGFEALVKDLAGFKKTVPNLKEASVEEYSEFLDNLFSNVDNEDRCGEVTLKTSASFKMLGELIDVLAKWGPIIDKWAQRSN